MQTIICSKFNDDLCVFTYKKTTKDIINKNVSAVLADVLNFRSLNLVY